MALIDVSGEADGTGDALASVGISSPLGGSSSGSGGAGSGPITPFLIFGGTLSGSGVASAGFTQTLLFSAEPVGLGDLSDTLLALVSGTASGTSTATATMQHIVGLRGVASGVGTFNLSIPEEIFGFGILTAFMEVLHVPRPLCPPRCTCSAHGPVNTDPISGATFGPGGIKRFRWLQTFQRGDLAICIRDVRGVPFGPYFIGYTMFTVSSTGVMHQVGPTDHKPVMATLGTYYATGTAGENGQPGNWAIRWRFQRSFGGPVMEQIQQFQVLDAVLAQEPLDQTVRVRKFGWN